MKPLELIGILLLAIFMSPGTFAHCKGKHSDYSPHCGDVDPPPPPPSNPALTFKGGTSDGIYIMDIDGSDAKKLGGGKNEDTRNVAWFPDGSGVVWTERRIRGGTVLPRIKYWDRNTDTVSIVFTPTTLADPWVGEQDSIETATDGCGITNQRLVYFIGANSNQPSPYSIFSFDVDNPSVTSIVLEDPDRTFLGLAVSKDGKLLATFSLPADLNTNEIPPGQLEIRDLCETSTPIVGAWTVDELGITSNYLNWLNELDWSHDFKLAAGQINEDVWMIDPFPASGDVTAVRLTGAGTEIIVGEQGTSPTWSPDSGVIAFVSEGGVYTINVSSGMVNQVSNKSARQIDWRDNWTPDP